MSVTIRRCCNSSVRKKEDGIVFNSWIITLDDQSRLMYAKVVFRLLKEGMFDPETPDVDAKILAHIFEVGLVHMAGEAKE